DYFILCFIFLWCFDCTLSFGYGRKGQSKMVFFCNLGKHLISSSLRFHLSALVLGLFVSQSAFAGSLVINWNPISSSALAGYKIKSGNTSGSYSQPVSVGKVTSYKL